MLYKKDLCTYINAFISSTKQSTTKTLGTTIQPVEKRKLAINNGNWERFFVKNESRSNFVFMPKSNHI